MFNCSDFLRDYSDYRDGVTDPAHVTAMKAHLAGCLSCARYDRVVSQGVSELKSAPRIAPSEDFLPRLQHRLYHLQDESAWWSRPDTSGTPVGLALVLVFLIGVAAWIPTLDSETPVVHLSPVLATAPAPHADLHTLFRSGPLLPTRYSAGPAYAPPANTVLFRHTRLGSNAAYQTVARIR
ncbi:MAG: zf-HC2 domain-containing protein [Gemmatimonadota bacterium]